MDLEKIRHSSSHVLAYAIKKLYPKVKLGIGPAIEDGFYYDFDNLNIKEEDLAKIEEAMKAIIKEDHKFKFKKVTRKEAQKLFKDEPYKLELLENLKDNEISIYESGDFTDLCKGPHINSMKEIKAIKLLRIAGAYWRGDSKNKMLTRVYGTAFDSEKKLKEYLVMLEEAEKRDHRKIGKQLDLFSFHEEAPSFPFWHERGKIIWNELENYIRGELRKEGYIEVKTPFIFSNELWKISGHWDHYKENMYFTKIDDKDFGVKPMNCPGHILIYNNSLHSYRELPIRMAEFGTVHRHELSGVIGGLLRVRHITQDDAHIFCAEGQIEQEVVNLINFTSRIYKTFGFNDYIVELSTRPEKFMGKKETWDKAEKALMNSLKKTKTNYKLNQGEGAFYGPKIDFHIKDAIGRKWQCTTIQLDFQMPERFKLTFEGEDGKKHTPIMIHRTILGSLERFIGVLIENYSGKFPLWLSPVQVKILTVNDRNIKFAKQVKDKLEDNNIRVELDDRAETISKKVRDATDIKPNYIVTIGDKEVKNKTLAVRDRNNKVKFGIKLDKFLKDLLKEIKEKK